MPTDTTVTLTKRQKDLLSAAALDMTGAAHPPGSKQSEAYVKLAHVLWEGLGEWTAAEFDEAFALAQQLPEPPVIE